MTAHALPPALSEDRAIEAAQRSAAAQGLVWLDMPQGKRAELVAQARSAYRRWHTGKVMAELAENFRRSTGARFH